MGLGAVTLRDYQSYAIKAALQATDTPGVRPIVTFPTGTGKSLVIGGTVDQIKTQWPHQQALVLHSSATLIEQNEKTFQQLIKSKFGTGVVSAKLGRYEWGEPVVFGSINSVYKHPLRFRNTSLIMIDECHLVSPKSQTMFKSFLTAVWKINPLCRLIGLSATPYRLGLGELTNGDIFTTVAVDGCSPEAWRWFLNEGWLSWLIPKQTSVAMDTSGLHTTAGDFQTGEMDDRYSADEVATKAAVTEAIHLAKDRKSWLVFCTGVKHAESTASFLRQAGRRAMAVHSKLTTEEQDKRIQAFRRGELDTLVNMNMLTTGFDVAGIDCIVMLRPTKSASLWVQMLGRGTRTVFAYGYPVRTAEERLAAIAAGPKPNCLVLDFARNTERLGPVDDPIIPKPGAKRKTGLVPQKVCEHKDGGGFLCHTYNPIAATHCIGCGEPFPEAETKLAMSASRLALISAGESTVQKEPKAKVERWVERLKPTSPPVAQSVPNWLTGERALNITYPTVRALRVSKMDLAQPWHKKLWRHLTNTPAPETVELAVHAFSNTAMPLAILVKRGQNGKIYPDRAMFDAVTLERDIRAFGEEPK